jgi:hypothetical protein
MLAPGAARKVDAHAWEREANEHYVEEAWCDARLFQVEQFEGTIQDPCCGFGRVVQAGMSAGLPIFGTDLVDRGFAELRGTQDFLQQTTRVNNVVGNPPFNIFEQFARQALSLTDRKVALIWLVRRLAAARWLESLPLARIWLMTPRPSMPPGHVITAGGKVGGGTQDFCWLVFDHSHTGQAQTLWLRRDP